MDLLIEIYWKIGIFFICMYLVLHYGVVLPFLAKRGSSGLFSWTTNTVQDRDLEKYREYCEKEDKPLIVYRFLSMLNRYAFAFIIGWIALLILSQFLDQ